jgi:type III secretory pathway component EscR
VGAESDLYASERSDFYLYKLADLWERYAYYESIFNIYPIWVDRESKFSFHTFVDRTASEMRAMLKETDNIFKEYLVQAVTGYDKNFLTQMEKKKIGETNYSD